MLVTTQLLASSTFSPINFAPLASFVPFPPFFASHSANNFYSLCLTPIYFGFQRSFSQRCGLWVFFFC